jgi:hypothetical protein
MDRRSDFRDPGDVNSESSVLGRPTDQSTLNTDDRYACRSIEEGRFGCTLLGLRALGFRRAATATTAAATAGDRTDSCSNPNSSRSLES